MHQKYLLSCATAFQTRLGHSFIYTVNNSLFLRPSLGHRSSVVQSHSLQFITPLQDLRIKLSDSIFLLPQIRSAPGDSKDASVATKKGGVFHCHFGFTLFRCTSRSQCGSSARRGAHFRRQLDRFCREMVRLPLELDYSDLMRFF